MQLRIKVRPALAGLAIVGGAAIVAALGPAGPAVGESSVPLQMQMQLNSGAVVAKGAGVEVSVTTQCFGEEPGSVSVQILLNERVGSGIASGSGTAVVDCTDVSQTSLVLVESSGSKPFKRGSAVAQGNINGCAQDLSACNTDSVEATIQIGG
ncbi:MAG TPA: hypothetical protein VEV45_00680 [Streptosporangiaceae bacterium]|nr:hypothetical protein [Streptosporangiaceae bacterium]